MEKPKSKQKSQTIKHKSASHRDARIILISFAILYSIFTVTAFIKTTYFWGINFLYYLPLWQKMLFISIGGLVFMPNINGLIYIIYQRIADIYEIILQRTQKFLPRVIYLVFLSICFGGVFYYFRVTSLYHGAQQALWFMNFDASIDNFRTTNEHTRNKPLLMLYLVFIRYIFKYLFNLSGYWSLALPSIMCGVLFIIVLDYFVRRLKLNPLYQFLIFILIFTQSITYHFYGFANYYALIPVVILAYVFFTVSYFHGAVSIIVPLVIGASALLVHNGTWFIIPSYIFLVLYLYRERIPFLYKLIIFHSIKQSVLVLFCILIVGYSLIYLGFAPKYLQEAVVSLFPTPGHRYTFFSVGYIIHLANVFVLSAPSGIVLCGVLFKYSKRISLSGDWGYYVIWMAVGGIIYTGSINPVGLFSWDGYAWSSIGFVILGGLLYVNISKELKYFTYLTTLIISHAILYFSAWLILNNNVYASVLNYIDILSPWYSNQVSVCLEIINNHIRDPIMHKRLLIKLEKKAKTSSDYLWLAINYNSLKELSNYQKFFNKTMQILLDSQQKDPNDHYICDIILSLFNNSEKYDPKNRNIIEPLYQKMIQLKPKEPNAYIQYSLYLNQLKDFQSAFLILERIDSLIRTENYPGFKPLIPYNEIKMGLVVFAFNYKNYLKTIKYFDEAFSLYADYKDTNFINAFRCCIISYARIGNLNKAVKLLKTANQNGILKNIDEKYIRTRIQEGKRYTLSLIKNFIYSENYTDLARILTYSTEDNDSPEFEIYRSVLNMDTGQSDFKNNQEDNRLSSDQLKRLQIMRALLEENYLNLFSYIHHAHGDSNKLNTLSNELKYLIGNVVFGHAQKFIVQKNNDSLAIYGNEMVNCTSDLFQGYILLGVYNNNIKYYSKADSLFDRAIALVKNSRVIPDPEATAQRIREIKINR